MRPKRFVVISVGTTIVAFASLIFAAELDDWNFPNPAPAPAHLILFVLWIITWPLAVYREAGGQGSAPGVLWGLLAVAGLFWATLVEVMLMLLRADSPQQADFTESRDEP